MHSRTEGDGHVRLIVAGELDVATVPQLRERLRDLEDRGAEVVLDLSAVTFLDSTTVRLLWSLAPPIVPPTGQARRLLELTGLVPRLALTA